ncbi:protein NKG7-like [Heteronotia binoei]|uniref:protein NKG7-like n=1 Tax=Heteronotia binoei TaxID=13085 RepID=UPI00292DD334|nr:protein NKG7-like [Heteronotia binoei]
MEHLQITACLFSFISLLLLIIALASDFWVVDLKNQHSGLWQTCRGDLCVRYGMNVPAFIHGTRAFMVMGMMAGTVSFFGLFTSFFRTHVGSISIKVITVSASIVAGVCGLIAMSTFTGMYTNHTSELGKSFGWSFAIGWVSSILFFKSGLLAYKAMAHSARISYSPLPE